ncbi:MAG: ATP-dependent DNA ligase [Anaerolineae bacterium]
MKFSKLVEYLAQLEATPKRLEMTRILGDLFQNADAQEMAPIVYLTQERLGPNFEGVEFGIGEALAAAALAQATGKERGEIRELYKAKGDYGDAAETLLPKRSKGLDVITVYNYLKEIATTSGEGTVEKKVTLLAELLAKMSSREGRYLLRIPMGRLRLGVGDVTVLDGLSWSATGDKSLRPQLERAYNLTSDLGLVASTFKAGGVEGLQKIAVSLGHPIRMELAERAKSAQEIIERMEGECALEPKIDGFRCQCHKDGKTVRIFSRNLEETTNMFPDIRDAVVAQVKAKTAILEGEAIGYDPETGEFKPFQVTVQRKRKHGIDEFSKDVPLRLMAFDLLYLNGKDFTGETYETRHNTLKKLIQEGTGIAVIEQRLTDQPKVVDEFFMEKIEAGLEGIVAKRLDSTYQAGARNFDWIKFKRAYQSHLRDTVDVVVVGYLLGRGQRARFGIGALLGAVYDKKNDRFRTIGKVGTGLSDLEWPAMKKMLDDHCKTPHQPARVDALMIPDVWCEPKYVVEVQADEITRSPIHTAGREGDEPGYALRFPRILNFVREDKNPEDATTEQEILDMFAKQGKAKTAD